ncbi:hypothetical protein RHK27_03300 [Clostridioides difficile]|nr:hypothetical protein [Clostridioides difficile]MDW0089116.1 hypothetical protein [Clostridioides difficile]MDW0089376.1 hypothetical protein [Clostridioides difficile]
MADFIVNRNIKKRRGNYSSRNLFEARAFAYENGTTFTGIFNVSDEKRYSVSSSTTFSLTSSVVYMPLPNEPEHQTGFSMEQKVRVEFINDPIINIDGNFENLSKGCTIKYSVVDQEPTIKFTITEKLNNTVLTTRNNTVGGNYEIILTNEQILGLDINSQNSLIIEISTSDGGLVTSKTVTFTRTNNKPVVTVNLYNSDSAKFIVSDLDNNLSKIEWYLDDVLKETITTDLYLEKTINYELTDNAIHTLKIVATDAENATAEKVLSISKEIMPLQSDASLSDISAKLIEIGEGFRNGKTSIINTLALKNIEASLNNTLVELSEKIKTSFDSSDASVQELQNRITELTNQLSQRVKWASGTYITSEKTNTPFEVPINLNFVPKIVIVTNSTFIDSSSPILSIEGGSISNLSNRHFNVTWLGSTRIASGITTIEKITASSFTISCGSTNSAVNFPIYLNKGVPVKWYAFDEI